MEVVNASCSLIDSLLLVSAVGIVESEELEEEVASGAVSEAELELEEISEEESSAVNEKFSKDEDSLELVLPTDEDELDDEEISFESVVLVVVAAESELELEESTEDELAPREVSEDELLACSVAEGLADNGELEDELSACPLPRARASSALTSSLVRHWSSTQIFSLARKVPANISPIPLAESANQFVMRVKKLVANDCEAVVVAVVVEVIAARLRLSSLIALTVTERMARSSMPLVVVPL